MSSSSPSTAPGAAGIRAAALTEAQAGLWYAQRLDPQNPVFNTGQYLEMRGPLDVEAFKRAVNLAMAEADGLTWTVADDADGPRLVAAPTLPPRLEVIDCSDDADPVATAIAAMRIDMATPIDLERTSATRQCLYLAGPDRSFWYQRIHHVFIDGYGTSLLLRRICDLYRSFVTGVSATTRPFAPFGPLLEADQAYRESAGANADRAYWTQAFNDRPDVVGLADGVAITSRSYTSVRAPFPAGVDQGLADVSASSGVNWPDILVALVGAYVQRHIGGREAIVGVPAMLRVGSVGARVPAMVMNVLPIRVSVDEDQPLGVVLEGLSAQMKAARKHGRYRSEQLRRDLGLLSDQRRLYGVLVNVLPFDSIPDLPGLTTELHVLGTGPVDDLTVTLRADANGAGLSLELDGNPRLYSADDLTAHGSRLAEFIGRALRATTLAEVPTVTAAEHRRWVVEVNDTQHAVADATLTALIESAMSRTPAATAVIDHEGALTYAELDALTADWARRLRKAGVGAGDIVAVLVPRSVELEVALVAVLRSGAAYLPVDAEYPRERVRVMFESARPKAVLTVSALADGVSPGVPVMLMDRPEPIDGPPALLPPVHPDDPAYVIYTSGSTGVPKGVVVQHRAIVNRLEWMRLHYGFDQTDRILQKTPATFDVSVWEFFLPLISGATLVMAPPEAHKDPVWLAQLIRDHQITALHFVPSMLAQFVAEPAVHGLCVHRTFCSGEALPAPLRDRFHEVVSGELHNLYGPTEAAVDVTYWNASRHDRSAIIPIGHPVWNTRMYVLDARMRPLPAGVAGDLYIAGVQLAREYLGQPRLTAERFVPDPFGAQGERMYRTGDVARWRTDGAIEFLGRSDHQVKIRGLRIELGEIEAALMACDGIAQAVVLAREDRPGDQRLVAYLVPREGSAAPDVPAILGALQNRLPGYMVPSAVVVLDRLPVNSTGKLDRRQLPPPEPGAALSSGRAPRTPVERRLVALVSDVLGLPPGSRSMVNADSDFFVLGGHSLLATQLMRRVREEWQCDLGLGVVFAHPTIAALAAQVESVSPARRLADDGLDVLLRLSAGTAPAALFCIHPAGGISWCYGALARALAPVRTVYGVQARGLDPAQPLPATLEAMAADYVREIKAIQPDGPYHLAGWSVGGIIAHAMACIFDAGGDRVGTLAMLDAYPSDRWRNEAEPDEGAALKALLLIAGLDPESAGQHPSREAVLNVLRASDHPLGSLSDAALSGVVRVVENNSRLVRHHRHQRFNGDLVHFRAALDHVGENLSPEEWRPYIGGAIEVRDVPSLHAHMTGTASSRVIGGILSGRISK